MSQSVTKVQLFFKKTRSDTRILLGPNQSPQDANVTTLI